MTCPIVCASLGPVEHDVHLPSAEGLIVLLINPADLPPPFNTSSRCDRADGGRCLRAQYADGATWTPADTSCSQISSTPYSARFSSMNPSMSLIGGLAPPGRNTRSLSSRSRWRAAACGSPSPTPGSAGHPHSSSPPEDHHQSPNASPRYTTPQDGHPTHQQSERSHPWTAQNPDRPPTPTESHAHATSGYFLELVMTVILSNHHCLYQTRSDSRACPDTSLEYSGYRSLYGLGRHRIHALRRAPVNRGLSRYFT